MPISTAVNCTSVSNPCCGGDESSGVAVVAVVGRVEVGMMMVVTTVVDGLSPGSAWNGMGCSPSSSLSATVFKATVGVLLVLLAILPKPS